jgi:hypothetical protein
MAENMEQPTSRQSDSDGAEMIRETTKENGPTPSQPTEATNGRAYQQQPPQQSKRQPAKQPSKLKQLWNKIGLDRMTLLIMVKGSLPPTIAIAMYQADAVAAFYGTIGYLVAILSVLSLPIMPRGKFIQHMTLLLLATCLAAAVNLLALYCAVKAREHTTPPGHSLAAYNSSASAVLALWLIVEVYFLSVLRDARPQFTFPCIVYSIFTIVSLTYATRYPTMASCIAFVKKILEAFLCKSSRTSDCSYL